MKKVRKRYLFIPVLVLALVLGPIAGASLPVVANNGVGVQLGVILDGSTSNEDWNIMRQGLADAIEDPDCVPHDGTVELTVVQGGGGDAAPGRLELGPLVIDSDTTANNAATLIRGLSQLGGNTRLYNAINLLANTMKTGGYYNTGRRSPTANSQWQTYPTFSYATRAYTQNNSGALANDNGSSTDDYHQYYGYGFNIPSNAVIDGIQVRIRNMRVSYGESKIRARLSWDGGNNWTLTHYTTPHNYWQNQWYNRDLGGSSDTWGRTWIADEINSGFRVRLRAYDTRYDTGRKDCHIDWVAVRVYYHVPSNFDPSLKQAIDIATDNDEAVYQNSQVVTARNNLLTTLQMTADQDELDVEFMDTQGVESDWLLDNIVWPQPGSYTNTHPWTPGWVHVVTSRADFKEAICEKMPGTIIAHKFNDLNGNGEQDEGEGDLEGWTMTLYEGSGCTGDPLSSGNTTTSGDVSFAGLTSGTYSVQETLKDGWTNTTPICQNVTLYAGGSETLSFGNWQLRSISGHKYGCDGTNCTGEGLEGWTIFIDENENGTLDGGETSTTTANVTGAYSFDNLEPGTYRVCEVLKDGWQNCTPTCVNVTVGAGQNTVVSNDTNTKYWDGDSWEPSVAAWEHSNWSTIDYDFSPSGADWVWESEYVDAPVLGDIVEFKHEFDIPGTPTSGTLHITVDNGYEVVLNGQLVGSAQVSGNWETVTPDLASTKCNRKESNVNTSGWESVETYAVLGKLKKGENTLEIKAANEYMGSECVDNQADGTTTSNPAGVIYELTYDFDAEVDFCNWQPGKITIVKETDPGGGTGFGFDAGSLGTFTLDDGETKTFGDLAAGDYTVIETVPGGWTLTSVNCTGGTCTNITNGVSINLGVAENVTCTFTNTFVPPKITVTKVVVGGGPKSAGDFNLHVQGHDFIGDGGGTVLTLTPGAYEVTEDDYRPAYSTTFLGNCTGTAAGGDVLSCTVTNTYWEPGMPLEPRMTIDMDVDPHDVVPGGQVEYTIDVINNDNDTATATEVSIWATLPAGFTYASTGTIVEVDASRFSTNPLYGDTTPTWGEWLIQSGGSVTIPFTVDVGIGVGPGTYDSTAYADGDNFGEIDDKGTVGQDEDTPDGEDPEMDEDVTIREVLPPPAVGGEAYPVNKIAILAPWIAIAMAIIAGGFIVVRRRRSVRLLRR